MLINSFKSVSLMHYSYAMEVMHDTGLMKRVRTGILICAINYNAMQVREMVYRHVWNLCTSVHKTFSTDAGIISSELYEVCFV